MNETIGILGCGWLGFPLATYFVSKGYKIHGSTASEEKMALLEAQGIEPFTISLGEDRIHGSLSDFLLDTDVLIINVPPNLRRGNGENYVQKMTLLHKAIKTSNVTKIIFVSSTSVYGNRNGEVTEATIPEPVTESGKQLWASEKLFSADPKLKTTIVRFGGLIGNDRHPMYFLSGKKGLSNGSAPVNLIHLDDCIKIISTIIKKKWWNETFNGVYPYYPSKREFYTSECTKHNLPVPLYNEDAPSGKSVKSDHLLKVKAFRFDTSIIS